MNQLKKPKISVIILHVFGTDHILNCLESVFKSDYPNLEVLVVFNGNNDNSLKKVQEKFSSVICITNKKNLGFVVGNNQGMERASGSIYFLLNDDTIIHSRLISVLEEELSDNEKTGIVGPKIYFANEPRKIWFAGGAIDWENQNTSLLGKNTQDKDWLDSKKEVEFITGCALMIKKEVVDKIGYLDKIFFAYYEDADWSLKARKAGYKIMYVPFGGVWHVKSATSSSIFFGKEKQRTIFWIAPAYLYRCSMGEFRQVRNKFIFFNRYLPKRLKNKFLLKSLFVALPSLIWNLVFHIPKSLIQLALKKIKHSPDFSQ